ncbi:uncharacterized protein ACB058_017872 [Synchiropus picturatus]
MTPPSSGSYPMEMNRLTGGRWSEDSGDDSFCFLGTTITEDLKWEPTIRSLIRKAQQRMFFLRQLRKLRLPTKLLVEFYTAIVQSILTSSITVWYNSATSRDKGRLQRIVGSEPTFPTLDMDCLFLFPLTGGYGPSRPEPPVAETASFPRPSDSFNCDLNLKLLKTERIHKGTCYKQQISKFFIEVAMATRSSPN